MTTSLTEVTSALDIPDEPDRGRMYRESGTRLRSAMSDHGVDALILLGNGNVVYATGASWPLLDAGLSHVERPGAIVLADDEHPHLYMPFREGAARSEERRVLFRSCTRPARVGRYSMQACPMWSGRGRSCWPTTNIRTCTCPFERARRDRKSVVYSSDLVRDRRELAGTRCSHLPCGAAGGDRAGRRRTSAPVHALSRGRGEIGRASCTLPILYATGASWPVLDAVISHVERPVAIVLADDEHPHLYMPFREGAAWESELPADHVHGPLYLEFDEGVEHFAKVLADLVPPGAT